MSTEYERFLAFCEKRRRAMLALRKKKWTYQRIADKYHLTHQRVQKIIKNNGG